MVLAQFLVNICKQTFPLLRFWLYLTECNCRQPLRRASCLAYSLPPPSLCLLTTFRPSVLTIRRLCVIFISDIKKEQEFEVARRSKESKQDLVTPGCSGLGVTWSWTLMPQIHCHFKLGWFWVLPGTTLDQTERLVVEEQRLRRVKKLPVLHDYFSEMKSI